MGFVIREQFSNVYKTSNIYTEILLGGLAVAFRMSHDLNVCFSQNVNLVPYFTFVYVSRDIKFNIPSPMGIQS